MQEKVENRKLFEIDLTCSFLQCVDQVQPFEADTFPGNVVLAH
jgi:hypothetical protein